MAAGSIQFKSTPPRVFLNKLKKINKKMAKKKPAMKRVAVFLDQWVNRNFATEGGKVGAWKPLKAGGRKKKGKKFDSSAKILRDTSDLQKSFHKGLFFTHDNAGIGSNLLYSKPHEEGIGHLPKRRILPRQADVKKDVHKILNGYVKKVTEEENAR